MPGERSTASEADRRLVTYGTLGPGRPNHGQLSDVPAGGLRAMCAAT